jgi:hypothetical protein
MVMASIKETSKPWRAWNEKKRNLRRKSLISKKKKEKNEYELSKFFL